MASKQAGKIIYEEFIQYLRSYPKDALTPHKYPWIRKKIYNALNQWCNEARMQELRIKVWFQENEKNLKLTKKGNVSISNVRRAVQTQENFNWQQLNKLFIDGYNLTHAIREFFTGGDIDYLIAFSGPKGSTLKGIIKHDDLIKPEHIRLANRFTISLDNIKNFSFDLMKLQIANKNYNKLKIVEGVEELNLTTGLFKALYDYYSEGILKNVTRKNGFVFEAYNLVVKEEIFEVYQSVITEGNLQGSPLKSDIYYLFHNSRLQTVIDMIGQSILNNISNLQGGDLGNQQEKFKSAQLTDSLGTIIRQAEALKDIFASKHKGEGEEILKIFTQDLSTKKENEFVAKADIVANTLAIDEIKKVLNSANISINI